MATKIKRPQDEINASAIKSGTGSGIASYANKQDSLYIPEKYDDYTMSDDLLAARQKAKTMPTTAATSEGTTRHGSSGRP